MHRLAYPLASLTVVVVTSCHKPSTLEQQSARLDDQPAAEGLAPADEGGEPKQLSTPPRDAGRPEPATSSAPARSAPAPVSASTGSSSASDSPYISRSPGEPHGMIVLWPRVIPRGTEKDGRDVTRRLQQHATELVRRAVPGKKIDIRPEPEQTCRRAGCDATAVGAMFSKQGAGCVAIAVITPPGPVETTLVPWAGKVQLKRTRVPFRTPPEGEVTVLDYASCDKLVDEMRANDAAVEAVIRSATP